MWHWTFWTCHLHNGTWCGWIYTESGYVREIQHFRTHKWAACSHYRSLNVHKLLCVGYVCDVLKSPKGSSTRFVYGGTLDVPASCWLPHVPEKPGYPKDTNGIGICDDLRMIHKIKAESWREKRKAWNWSLRLALALLDLLAPKTQMCLPLSLKRFKTFKRLISTTTVCRTLSASPTCNWVRLENVKRNLQQFDQDWPSILIFFSSSNIFPQAWLSKSGTSYAVTSCYDYEKWQNHRWSLFGLFQFQALSRQHFVAKPRSKLRCCDDQSLHLAFLGDLTKPSS